MKKRSGIAIVISSLVLVLVAFLAFVYFVLFDSFTLVSDISFNQVYSSYLMKDRLHYAAKGLRLRVKTLDETCFYDKESFIAELSRIKGDYVLLSPLPSWYACQNEVNVSNLLPGSVVLGIGAESAVGYFDCLLVSDERAGWVEAGKAMAAETSSMSQNIGLVYDLDSIDYASDIIGCFRENRVSVFNRDGSSRLFASTTLDAMNKQGIVLALCPYATSFNSFFNSDSTVSWVVDYRLASVVPSENLYGVVRPDLSLVLELAKATQKGQLSMNSLGYCYEKK